MTCYKHCSHIRLDRVIFMKSVVIGGIAAILIAIAAGAVLNGQDSSSAAHFSTENARVN